jgi:hypothetical protein
MICTRRSGRFRAGAALAILGFVAQVGLASIGGLAALDADAEPSVIEICTAYGIQRIALPPDSDGNKDRAPAPSGTLACHVFCSAHGPTLPASVALPRPAFKVPAGSRPIVTCEAPPVLRAHQPLLARPPPAA